MDVPLGIISVVGVAGQIIIGCVKLGLNWKDAPVDVRYFNAELQTLQKVLSEAYSNIIKNYNAREAFEGRHSPVQSTLSGDGQEPHSTPAINLATCGDELKGLLLNLGKLSGGGRIG